jgi:hypothetical protein
VQGGGHVAGGGWWERFKAILLRFSRHFAWRVLWIPVQLAILGEGMGGRLMVVGCLLSGSGGLGRDWCRSSSGGKEAQTSDSASASDAEAEWRESKECEESRTIGKRAEAGHIGCGWWEVGGSEGRCLSQQVSMLSEDRLGQECGVCSVPGN